MTKMSNVSYSVRGARRPPNNDRRNVCEYDFQTKSVDVHIDRYHENRGLVKIVHVDVETTMFSDCFGRRSEEISQKKNASRMHASPFTTA